MGSARSLREKERVWRNRSTHWREGGIGLSAIIGLFLKYVIFIKVSRFLYIVPLLFQVGFALQSGLNVIPCFGEKLEEREAGRTMEVETLTFTFANFEIMDHGGRFSFSHFCCNVFVLFVRFLKPWTMEVATHSFSIFFGFEIIPGCPNLEVAIFFD